MKFVAIIGAGPSGLVAAQKLLQTKDVSVTIFEKSHRIGGAWARDDPTPADMHSNLTHFTTTFSDLSWCSLELDRRVPPVYPTARQVHKYLEEYYMTFIPTRSVRLNTEVVAIERSEPGGAWRIKSSGLQGTKQVTQEEAFDYLVVAAGFSASSRMPNFSIGGAQGQKRQLPVLHSTEYRQLRQILSPDIQVRNKILIVGESQSGNDAAISIAQQLSHARHSRETDSSLRQLADQVDIIDLSTDDTRIPPSFVRVANSERCFFQPIEFSNYRLPDTQSPLDFCHEMTDEVSAETETKRNGFGKTSQESQDMLGTQHKWTFPPQKAVSDTYRHFVHSGAISSTIGTLKSIKYEGQGATATAIILRNDQKQSEIVLQGITAVIYCTRHEAPPIISLFPRSILEVLEFDASYPSVPLLLDTGCISQNHAIPNLSVIGFPHSHWGIYEMQARWAARACTAEKPPTLDQLSRAKNLATHIRKVRRAIKTGGKEKTSQEPFGDYVGLMEQACSDLELPRFDTTYRYPQLRVAMPALYKDPDIVDVEARKTISLAQNLLFKMETSGLFVAQAIFRALLGSWYGKRLEPAKSASVKRDFHFRFPTSPRYDFEYLVIDSPSGRRAVWRYDESTDRITTWDVGTDGLSAATLISTLEFPISESWSSKGIAMARKLYHVPISRMSPDTDIIKFEFDEDFVSGFSEGGFGVGTYNWKIMYRRQDELKGKL
ncbi:hypothetical protein BS50DRAFT_54875 [Corynespora cassiicola Philippines]|uniref:FAD/NAD(P)-binding domain-containing protein n=1 Tax=Corynespora cassiicola Philippines TaxID=1448308 RepID=A0A2T2NIM4_CORCC|nr:hypothetical protein BS50DRAFT_54875 [Corynespora cassiicola Philippines]